MPSRWARSDATSPLSGSPTRPSSPRPTAGSSASCGTGSPPRSPTTGWSARSTAPTRGRRPPAGTSTRSTAPTTTSAASRSSGRSSPPSGTASCRPQSSPRRRCASAGTRGAAEGRGPRAGSEPNRRASASRASPTLADAQILYTSPVGLERSGRAPGFPGAARDRLARPRVRRLLELHAGRPGRGGGDAGDRPQDVGRRGAHAARRGGRRPGHRLRWPTGHRQPYDPRNERPPARQDSRSVLLGREEASR